MLIWQSFDELCQAHLSLLDAKELAHLAWLVCVLKINKVEDFPDGFYSFCLFTKSFWEKMLAVILCVFEFL